MNRLSKLFLAACLVLTAAGLIVTFTPIPISPLWSILLPYGAIFYGLFLISFVFQKEFADDHQGEQTEMHSSQQRNAPASGRDLPAETAFMPHRHAHG